MARTRARMRGNRENNNHQNPKNKTENGKALLNVRVALDPFYRGWRRGNLGRGSARRHLDARPFHGLVLVRRVTAFVTAASAREEGPLRRRRGRGGHRRNNHDLLVSPLTALIPPALILLVRATKLCAARHAVSFNTP